MKHREFVVIRNLPLIGETLQAVQFDVSVVLYFGVEREYRLRILEQEFELHTGAGDETVQIRYSAWEGSPVASNGLPELVSLINQPVRRSRSLDGQLAVEFDLDYQIVVKPGGQYESWSIEGPVETIFCLGNGKISVARN